MGEIAEGLINGDFDSVTGEYLGHGDGFPRSIMWGKPKPHGAAKFAKYVNQVKHFMIADRGLTEPQMVEVMNEYRKHINLTEKRYRFNKSCREAYFDWKEFRKFADPIIEKIENKQNNAN